MWSNVVLDNADDKTVSPVGRSKHGVAFDGQALYLYGGKSGTYPLKDFWKLDLRAGEWTNLKVGCADSEWPPALQEHTIVHHNKKLYVFGGEIGLTDDHATPLWMYNIKTQVWRKWNSNDPERNKNNKLGGKGLTPVGRRGHAACVYNNYMFIYGGYRDLKGSLGDLWAFHFETESWHLFYKPLPIRFYWSTVPAPSERHNHSMVEYNDCLYVYGGMRNLEERSDCWKYSLAERKWMFVKVKHGPGPLRGHVACAGLGNMILMGGERDGKLVDEMWRFSFGSETFHRLTFHGCRPSPRVFPACVMLPAVVRTIPKQRWRNGHAETKKQMGDGGQSSSTKGFSPTNSVENENKYWWDDELVNVCSGTGSFGGRYSSTNNGSMLPNPGQNPLKNINIIRDFSNRLNNHRLGNYQALDSAIVDECGVSNSVSPMTLSSPSSSSEGAEEEEESGLSKIDEDQLIEISEVQIKQLPGILSSTKRSESVTFTQSTGTKTNVRKSSSTVRFADYNMPNSTSDYVSMDTLTEDKSRNSKVFADNADSDGFDNPNYAKKNNLSQEIEMTCFKQTGLQEPAEVNNGNSSKSRAEEQSLSDEVQIVTTPNYLLLVGGLEVQTAHLLQKPLSLWRLRVSPELFQNV